MAKRVFFAITIKTQLILEQMWFGIIGWPKKIEKMLVFLMHPFGKILRKMIKLQ